MADRLVCNFSKVFKELRLHLYQTSVLTLNIDQMFVISFVVFAVRSTMSNDVLIKPKLYFSY
jgi:hypothetical protein